MDLALIQLTITQLGHQLINPIRHLQSIQQILTLQTQLHLPIRQTQQGQLIIQTKPGQPMVHSHHLQTRPTVLSQRIQLTQLQRQISMLDSLNNRTHAL